MLEEGIAVVGAFQTHPREQVLDRSLEEMVFEAVRGALLDADLTIADIDAVMLSTTDQVEGRVIESMVVNGAAGGVGRDVTTLTSSGEHAFAYAATRIGAGHAKRALVVVWSKASESVDPDHADLLAAEPFLLRPLGMRSNVAAGLQASAYVDRYGYDRTAIDELRAKRTRAAATAHNGLAERVTAAGIVAWPLERADLPRECDVACAMVLAAGDAVDDEQIPAWISGVGWATDRYELAERDLTRFESLGVAGRMALGPEGSAKDVDVVEIQEISSVGGFAAYESLGLAESGQGSTLVQQAVPALNPSGGNLPVSPGNAAGFLRLLAAAQQVRGRAGAVQVSPQPKSAIGAALHGFAGQGAVVALFTSEKAEVAHA